MDANIQAWPTPEIFIKSGNPLLVNPNAASFTIALATFHDAFVINGGSISDSGNAKFALSNFTDGGARLNSSVADGAGVSFALSSLLTVTPVSASPVSDNAKVAFAMSSFTNYTPSTTSIADSGNATFALASITA